MFVLVTQYELRHVLGETPCAGFESDPRDVVICDPSLQSNPLLNCLSIHPSIIIILYKIIEIQNCQTTKQAI